MKRTLFWIVMALLGPVEGTRSQEWVPPRENLPSCSGKGERSHLLRPGATGSAGSTTIDVTHYGLDLALFPAGLISGSVTVTARITADTLSSFILDLSGSMTADSVVLGGRVIPHVRDPAAVGVSCDRIYRRGESVTATIHYHGRPAVTGFGSFVFSSNQGTPWIWSLSEPYGAREWWPCKDHPLDKADSADIRVTVPDDLIVGSNGILVSVTPRPGGTRIHYWKERYPIATYLVSVAAAEFSVFSNWFHTSPSDSMEILNYVIPQHLEEAQRTLPRTVEMLEIFTDAFGEYPFIREKYGHAEFGWGGAMEHQTMTSTTTFDESVLAHELAHQWFGDLITCGSWSDLWLNEGFATFAEALYAGAVGGSAAYAAAMSAELQNAKQATGTLYVQDTSSVRNLFDSHRVYSKGAAVLHMLRKVLGDSTFARALRAYVADPRFRYGTATTRDFQGVCESVSGTSLGYFFDQWVFGERYPIYQPTWSAAPDSAGATVAVRLGQTTRTSNPAFFRMPVDLRFSAAGRESTVTVLHSFDGEEFHFRLPFLPSQVDVDPGEWILRDIVTGNQPLPEAIQLAPNYPNPFNAGTSIEYTIPQRSVIELVVHSLLGQRLVVLADGPAEPGTHTVRWDGRRSDGASLPSGIYLLRLTDGTSTVSRRLVLLK